MIHQNYTPPTPLSDAAIAKMAAAIFSKQTLTVVECYSEFDQELREFASEQELRDYCSALRDSKGGPHLAVHYADEGGGLEKVRIQLTKCDDHTFRYMAAGGGAIFVYLQVHAKGKLHSFISGYSEKWALNRAAHDPEYDAAAVCNWRAVDRHTRRLRRVLKLVSREP